MDATEQFSALVGDIYDAAFDRALWPAVLEKTCGFVQGALPYDEYLASRFHIEWAKPQGYCDFVGALLDKSITSFANPASCATNVTASWTTQRASAWRS